MNHLRLSAVPLLAALLLSIGTSAASITTTGSMSNARCCHTATLLLNGKILIAGGWDGTPLAAAELYDPATGTFSATGNLVTARSAHTATLLPNGKVLIAGGARSTEYLSSAELYDPETGVFTQTGGLLAARRYHTATLLRDGKVLIVGGQNSVAPYFLTSAELYDPATGIFSATGSLQTKRDFHTAALLANGKVLIAGGAPGVAGSRSLASAELYDPASGAFSPAGSMCIARQDHSATLLPNGKVLLYGGYNDQGSLNTSELYDPVAGAFTLVEVYERRQAHTATLLPDDRLLIAGGYGPTTSGYLSSVVLYDTASQQISGAGMMATERGHHTATLLPNGKVLFAGGVGAGHGYLASAEVYDNDGEGTFQPTGSMPMARAYHTTTLLSNGKVLLEGGTDSTGQSLLSAELYDPATGTFTATGSRQVARYIGSYTTTLLANGKVLIAGGEGRTSSGDSISLGTAELYDPVSGTFTPTGGMMRPRQHHAAMLLPNGKVLIVGGFDPHAWGGYLFDAELYDPSTGTFRMSGGGCSGGEYVKLTALTNGKVLVTGGFNPRAGDDFPSTAWLYDPVHDRFSATGALTTGRIGHRATLLPTGKVLITGGRNAASGLALPEELYDADRGVFEPTGRIAAPYGYPVATLPNGKLLFAGSRTSLYLYDALNDTFTATAERDARYGAGAALLPDGKVLFAGGQAGSGGEYLTIAELYDSGGLAELRRPSVTSAPEALELPATLTMTGTGFCGDSEASGGGMHNSSATNYPLLQLQSLTNDQISFVPGRHTDTSWSADLVDLPVGVYRASIVTNALPSTQQLIRIVRGAPTLASVSPNRGPASGGQSVTLTGMNLGGSSVILGGNAATVTQTSSTTATLVTPAHIPAVVDLTVTNPSGASMTSTGAYTYVADAPTNVIATAFTTTSVTVTWSAAPGATSYRVLRSADGVHWVKVGDVTATAFTDAGAAADTAYLYVVRVSKPSASDDSSPDIATTILFADDPIIPGTPIKAIHLTQLRTAIQAVGTLAGFTSRGFTDFEITPGVTMIKAAHIRELSEALQVARATLLLSTTGPWPFPSAGAKIYAADINNLRAGLK